MRGRNWDCWKHFQFSFQVTKKKKSKANNLLPATCEPWLLSSAEPGLRSLLELFEHPLLKDSGRWRDPLPRDQRKHWTNVPRWPHGNPWSRSGHEPTQRLDKCTPDQGMVHPSTDVSGAFPQFLRAERDVPQWKPCQGFQAGYFNTTLVSMVSPSFGQGVRNRWHWCCPKPASFWTSAVKSLNMRWLPLVGLTKRIWVVPRKPWKIPPC